MITWTVAPAAVNVYGWMAYDTIVVHHPPLTYL